jgi:hypothetical protein
LLSLPLIHTFSYEFSQVDGRMTWLSAGDTILWGVSHGGNIFYRSVLYPERL